MPGNSRFFPPPGITRFNYWILVPPRRPHELQPTLQRLGEYPEDEDKWTDLPPGEGALERHIKKGFHADLKNSPYQALYDFALDYKEWRNYPPAQEVLGQLTPEERGTILQLDKTAWPPRSKQPEGQLMHTWSLLLKDIAGDLDKFEDAIDNPPTVDQLTGTTQRRYLCYRNKAIELLGGGKFIPAARRRQYPDLLDDSPSSTLLTPDGRLPGKKSWFDVNWLELPKEDQPRALKLTLHWFAHALRNLHLYRDGHRPIPWTPQCEKTCRRIQKRLLVPRPPRQR